MPRRKFHVVCRDTDKWPDTFLDLIGRNVKDPSEGGYETDGHYLDQFDAMGSAYVCFASNHSYRGKPHVPGFSNSNAIASRRLVQDLHRKSPQTVWMGEHCPEMTVDLVQDHYVIHPSYYRYELVSLWTMVHQGYTSLHEWPMPRTMLEDIDNFSSSIAWSVHLGFKLGSFVHIETWMDLFKPEKAQILAYLQNLISMQLKMMNIVAYGQRLKAPV